MVSITFRNLRCTAQTYQKEIPRIYMCIIVHGKDRNDLNFIPVFKKLFRFNTLCCSGRFFSGFRTREMLLMAILTVGGLRPYIVVGIVFELP